MTVDLQFHIAELLTLLAMAAAVIVAVIKVVRAADRVTGVLRDFPPHRHVNGSIIYPDGYVPTRVDTISPKASSASAGS